MTDPWCVGRRGEGGRTEWCIAKDQTKKPNPEADSIATLCDYFIILGYGVARQKPTCEDCLLKGK